MPFKNLESKKDADGNVKKQDFIDCAAADLKGDTNKAELVYKVLAGNSDKVHVIGDQFKWKSSFIRDFIMFLDLNLLKMSEVAVKELTRYKGTIDITTVKKEANLFFQ